MPALLDIFQGKKEDFRKMCRIIIIGCKLSDK